jgi:hypothetical protein
LPAIPIVFLSDKGFDEGAVADSPTIRIRPNEVHQLHLWVNTDVLLTDVSLDLFQSNGVLDFIDAIVHRPTSVAPYPVVYGTQRWIGVSVGQISPEFIRGMSGGVTPNFGIPIGPDVEDVDELFDPEVAAFLFATVNFTATIAGQTDLFLTNGGLYSISAVPIVALGTGDEPVENLPGAVSRLPDATIMVIPEPQSNWAICSAALIGLTRRPYSRELGRPSRSSTCNIPANCSIR